MKTITVNVLQDNETGSVEASHIIESFSHMLANGPQHSIKYHESLNKRKIQKLLKAKYGDRIEIQNSVYEGCYGSSSGNLLAGFQVFVDSSLFPERFIDSDGDEIVNIEALCEKYGTEIKTDDVYQLLKTTKSVLGDSGKSDNTYNYLGHDSDSPVPLCHADFILFETEKECFVFTKFHCGGDIRGNYSKRVVYEFADIEDAYNAFVPMCELKEEQV